MSFRDFLKEQEESNVGFITDIEKDTVENENYREVLFTGEQLQLVIMALKSGEEIGEEVHEGIDQFFRVDEGSGKVVMDGNESEIKDGSAFIIPGGTKHNVVAGEGGLKLYTIYAPPEHPDGTIQKSKEEGEEDGL